MKTGHMCYLLTDDVIIWNEELHRAMRPRGAKLRNTTLIKTRLPTECRNNSDFGKRSRNESVLKSIPPTRAERYINGSQRDAGPLKRGLQCPLLYRKLQQISSSEGKNLYCKLVLLLVSKIWFFKANRQFAVKLSHVSNVKVFIVKKRVSSFWGDFHVNRWVEGKEGKRWKTVLRYYLR